MTGVAEALGSDENEAGRRAQWSFDAYGRGLRPGRSLRLDEPSADGVAGELDAIAHPELLEDVRSVALHGLLRDEQHRGDVVVRVSLGDQLDDLLLARREQLPVRRLAG